MNEPQLTPLNANWVVKFNEDPKLIEENKMEVTIEFNNEQPTK